jgi:hypothetical protein
MPSSGGTGIPACPPGATRVASWWHRHSCLWWDRHSCLSLEEHVRPRGAGMPPLGRTSQAGIPVPPNAGMPSRSPTRRQARMGINILGSPRPAQPALRHSLGVFRSRNYPSMLMPKNACPAARLPYSGRSAQGSGSGRVLPMPASARLGKAVVNRHAGAGARVGKATGNALCGVHTDSTRKSRRATAGAAASAAATTRESTGIGISRRVAGNEPTVRARGVP